MNAELIKELYEKIEAAYQELNAVRFKMAMLILSIEKPAAADQVEGSKDASRDQ